MPNSKVIDLATQLINIKSITPNDNGCQEIIANKLRDMGFTITNLPSNGVSNLWAEYGDASQPFVIFSGHTDVVPAGEIRQWASDPFISSIKNNRLYGRGAADMKGALAAMIIGCERFLAKHPSLSKAIGFMITSDEEGDATHGTTKLVDYVLAENKNIQQCIIGEASCEKQLGDNIKIGRRGSLHGKITIIGKQGHIAYPKKSLNPIHNSFKALDQLTQITWDNGNDHFMPTSFQIYNIHADTGANNMIPGQLTANFNLRYSPELQADDIQQQIIDSLKANPIEYDISWNHSSKPFFSNPGALADAATTAVQHVCNITPTLNTHGGTSDGRFISRIGCEIIELGVTNKSIHQVNEYADIDDLNNLSRIYEHMLGDLLLKNPD